LNKVTVKIERVWIFYLFSEFIFFSSEMAYRPPTTSRFAAFTSAPPPVPVRYAPSFSESSKKEEDGWKTIAPKKQPAPFLEPVVHRPGKRVTPTEKAKETEKTFTADEFPALGGRTIKSSVPKSASTESMAERMKKKLKEEEEERIRMELEKAEEEEKKKNDMYSSIPGVFISNTQILKRFEKEYESTYENRYGDDDGYGYDLEEDGYGYRPRTPQFPLHDKDCEYYNEDENENENDGWSK
jgi:hypothetical protein